MNAKKHFGRKGFTLIETCLAIAVVSIAGIGIVSSVVVTRHLAELDKQRLAALSAARLFMEEGARQQWFPLLGEVHPATLDNFNTPDELDDLHASIEMHTYEVNRDGSRGAEVVDVENTDLNIVEVEVTIKWNRTGRLSSRRMTESLHTYFVPNEG